MIVFNTLTHYALGPSQLKKKLLTGSFSKLSHRSDSALVRNYCLSEDPEEGNHWVFDLKKEEASMKEKLDVRTILYPGANDNWSDYGCGVSYQTKNNAGGWFDLLRLFQGSQTEILTVDHKYKYERRVQYRWCFFFWVKQMEYFNSTDIPSDTKK